MRPTRGRPDDRPRARTAPPRLVRGRGRRDRDGARRPAPGPRHDPGDDAGTASRTRRTPGLHAAGRRRGPDRRRRSGRRFRDHQPAAGRDARAERRGRRPQRIPGIRDAGADPEHPAGRFDRLPSARRQGPHAVTAATCHARAPDSSSSERTGTAPTRSSPMGTTNQVAPVWSPDGTRLLYFDEGKLYLTDPSGGGPQPVDTGCAAPCMRRLTGRPSRSDGASLAFIRESEDPAGHTATSRRSRRWTSRAVGS